MLPPGWRTHGLVPLLVLASMPFCQAMGHQQNTFLSLLLLTVAVTCWRSELPLEAGLVTGLLFYKPQLALVVALVLVADQGRRAVLGLGVAGVLTLVATVWVMPGALHAYTHSLQSNLDWIQEQHAYNWGRQVTFLGFWRLLIQGREVGSPAPIVRTLWIASALAALTALAVGFVRARRSGNRDRLIATAIACTPLLIPYFMDYDLLLLAVPAVLFANEVIVRGTMSRADRWALRGWVALGLWCYLNPGVSPVLRLSLTVPLLALVAGCLFAGCGADREEETVPHETESVEPARAVAA